MVIRLVMYLLLFAAVLYFVFWAIDRRNSGGDTGPVRPLPRGPIGPDDDEAFLRDLNRSQRRDQPPAAPPPPPPAAPPASPPSSQETHEHPE